MIIMWYALHRSPLQTSLRGNLLSNLFYAAWERTRTKVNDTCNSILSVMAAPAPEQHRQTDPFGGRSSGDFFIRLFNGLLSYGTVK